MSSLIERMSWTFCNRLPHNLSYITNPGGPVDQKSAGKKRANLQFAPQNKKNENLAVVGRSPNP